MFSIGARVKEERERLGMTIPEFADAAGAKKNTVIEVQLSALAEVGIDVVYVITGHRSAPVVQAEQLNMREKALLANYRGSDDVGKRAVETTASALAHRVGGKQAGSGK